MKTLRTLKISPNAPDINSVWLYKGTMKYFNNGEWETIGGGVTVDWNDITNKPDFATVATSGSYNDLSDKPTIPSAYVLPVASTTTLGGIKIGYTASGKNYAVQLSNNTAFVNVPWTDTTYRVATTTTDGLMPSSALTKLNGIATGANNYVLPVAGSSIGGVKIAAKVPNTDATVAATAQTVATSFNSLLAALRASGVLTA